MTFKELQEQVKQDLTIEPASIEEKLYKIPVLHSKYLRIYIEAKQKYENLMLQMDKLYRTKWHTYSTDGYNGYKLKTQKEVIIYIEGDTEIINKRSELNRTKRLIDYMKEVVDKVSKLSFDVKNIIDYTKWINGGQV